MTEQPAPLAQLIHHLHAQGRLRVWSVIVTILGELGEPEGGELSMSALLELCAALEIEPQAVRTAMSRLSKEGLVTGRRLGRQAFYRFSSAGLEQYYRAARQIYAAPRDIEHWCYGLIGLDVDLSELQKDCAAEPPLIFGARLACWPAAAMPEGLKPWRDRLVIFDSTPITFPDWARRQVFPALNAESCGVIARLCGALDKHVMTVPQARLTRLLLVHFWRRLVLRYPTIEAPLDDWPLARAHRALASLYPQLVQMSGGTPDCVTRFAYITKKY